MKTIHTITVIVLLTKILFIILEYKSEFEILKIFEKVNVFAVNEKSEK